MRIRTGIDIIKTERIEKILGSGKKAFIDRCFTPDEQAYCNSFGNMGKKAESFAGRFAVKEAAAKALGTGIMTDGIAFTDIEVVKDGRGMPEVSFWGGAAKRAEEIRVKSTSISISHDGGYAAAVCTLLTDEED